jgi:hypothetical protein
MSPFLGIIFHYLSKIAVYTAIWQHWGQQLITAVLPACGVNGCFAQI